MIIINDVSAYNHFLHTDDLLQHIIIKNEEIERKKNWHIY